MKYDVVIIGGGLSALSCGITLTKAGKKCAIVSAGQNFLHFSSGSFDLLSYLPDGTEIVSPKDDVAKVAGFAPRHPYAKLGKSFSSLASKAKEMLRLGGIETQGLEDKNHYRISPSGEFCPTWLTLPGTLTSDRADTLKFKKVAILNIDGFLDFYPEFIADSLQELGTECTVDTFSSSALEAIRNNPSEMRSANIARAFDSSETRAAVIAKIKALKEDVEAVVLPSVLGLNTADAIDAIAEATGKKIFTCATMPPSVPGINLAAQLRREFERNGGRYMLGDKANGYESSDRGIVSVSTVNLGNDQLEAEAFVLASGSIFSSGLSVSVSTVTEPLFGCDVAFDPERSSWYGEDLLDDQPFERFGVKTDDEFHASKDGKPINNLFVIGSILEDTDPTAFGCREGVDMLTGIAVAEKIIGK